MNLSDKTLYNWAIYTLSFLWIFTGLTSAFFSPETGYQILATANITGDLADFCVYGGALLDIVLGLWLISLRQVKLCCVVQVVTIAVYSILLTLIEPGFWLHPFGPVTKNLPIVVLIGFIYNKVNAKMDVS